VSDLPLRDPVSAVGPAAPRTRSPWIALTAVAIGMFVVALDGTITAVANPVLATDLGATLGGLQWITNAYLLAMAGALVLAGKIGDRWGRTRAYLFGVVGFGIASTIIGLAPNVGTVVAGRALQGVFGALIITNSLALIRSSFPVRKLPGALSAFAAIVTSASAGGPVIGGLLVGLLSWRWAFLINAPIALVALSTGLRFLPRGRDRSSRTDRFDIGGAVTLVIALSSGTYGLISASERGWTDSLVWGCLIVGALAAITFVLVERRAADPLVPLRLFRDRSISIGVVLSVLTFFALVGAMFFALLFLQQVNGDTPVVAGLHMLPMSLASVVGSSGTGRVIGRFGVRAALVTGMALSTAGFVLFGLVHQDSSTPALALPFGVLGLGLGMVMTATVQVILANAPERDAGSASGIQQTANQIGGVLGIAVLGALMTAVTTSVLTDKAVAAGVPEAVAAGWTAAQGHRAAQGIAPAYDGSSPGVAESIWRATQDSFVAGMQVTMWVAAAIMMVGTLLALGVRAGRTPDVRTISVVAH
jgi:EmrB/QacA subfamily drug resistance transporter